MLCLSALGQTRAGPDELQWCPRDAHQHVIHNLLRLSTTGLLTILCMLYNEYHLLFLGLIVLDIFSHWFQMYSTFVSGSSTHKARLRLVCPTSIGHHCSSRPGTMPINQ